MLHELGRNDDIADVDRSTQATRDARKNDLPGAKMRDQRRRRGGSGDLADSGQGQHHRHAMQLTEPEVATGMHKLARVSQLPDQAVLLLR